MVDAICQNLILKNIAMQRAYWSILPKGVLIRGVTLSGFVQNHFVYSIINSASRECSQIDSIGDTLKAWEYLVGMIQHYTQFSSSDQ